MNEKKQSTWKTFRRLFPTILSFKIELIIAIITLIINAITDAFMISLLKPLLDEGFGETNNKNLNWLPITILGLILIRGVSSFISNYLIALVSGKIVMNMRKLLFSHMIQMPVSFFEQKSTGDLLSKISYDTEQIAISSSSALISIIRESVYIVGLFILIFYYSWRLSLILIFITPILIFFIRNISKHFRKISKNIQTDMGKIISTTEQILKGHKEILIFGRQKYEKKKFNKINKKIYHQTMKMVTISSISDPIVQLIASFALILTIYISNFPSITKNLTAGTIGVVFSGIFALMRPLKLLTNINVQFQKGMAACQKLFSILDMKKEEDKGKIILKNAKGEIEFKHVTFKYPNKKKPILHDVSFKIQAGKFIALVGKSGSGKSTIANLITRFYEINKGQILLDKKDLKKYTLSSLRNQISFISQYTYLFNDSIANNIAYSTKKKYNQKEIQKAAQMGDAMEFIKKLDKGINTIIGENGIMLSGGQKQKIAIARALLHNSSILILDEATSALDSKSEKNIQKIFRNLKKNKTFIIITHKLSTIKKADEILFIKNGKIIQKENYKKLFKKYKKNKKIHKI